MLPREDGGAGLPCGYLSVASHHPIAPFKGMAFASIAGSSGFPHILLLVKVRAGWLLPWLG